MSDKISAIENQSLFADLSQGESDAIKGGFNWEEYTTAGDATPGYSHKPQESSFLLVGEDLAFLNGAITNNSDVRIDIA